MGRLVYSLIYYLIFPAIWVRLWVRSRKAPAYGQRWHERLGMLPLAAKLRLFHHKAGGSGNKVVWVHAVSVGETVAAIPLIRRLQQRYPQWLFVVTTMTPTGSDRVTDMLGDSVVHVYAPYDTPGAVRLFLRTVRPDVLLIMETELWPNMVEGTRARNIPVVLVNGRLSENSAGGYAKVAWVFQPMVRAMTRLLVQTEDHARRFERLGAVPGQVQVTGSIKFDLDVPEPVIAAGKQVRGLLGESRRVWIAASTHAGEDELILAVHQRLIQVHPDLCLILVPRHPERFDSVCQQVQASGLTYSRQSELATLPAGATLEQSSVHVGDTMGELMALYAASDLAFVGGSLVPTGGHNPIEPAALGLPVLMGPHTFNFEDICGRLTEAGGLLTVSDAPALEARLKELMAHPDVQSTHGQRAQAFVENNRGALQLCTRTVESLIS